MPPSWACLGIRNAPSQCAAEAQEGRGPQDVYRAPSIAHGRENRLPALWLQLLQKDKKPGGSSSGEPVSLQQGTPVQESSEEEWRSCGCDCAGCLILLVQSLELLCIENVIFRLYLRLFDQSHSLHVS